MRVLELYAGIGGMHIAFKGSTVKHEVVAAVEINDVATDVYKYNFPNTLTLNRVIEQFLLSPLQFGIPNCRLRFYLLARLRSSSWNSNFKMGQSESIDMRPPVDAPMLPGCQCTSCSGVISHIEHTDDNFTEYIQFCRPISEFVLVPSDSPKELYFLDEKCLQRYFRVLDIVRSCDKKTRCFTKGYSKRLEGTGSVFQTSMENEVSFFYYYDKTSEKITNYYEANKEDEQAVLQYAKLLKLRFFHSREVANMMCFPKSF
ncbi:tRNA (cytosine38-C5)-methyltransferase, partial [Schistosoma bovis]